MKKMKVNIRLISILTILLIALVPALPVYATVGGTVTIVRPDITIAGGPVEIDAALLTATGGTIYFYLSTDNDPIISSGDVKFASKAAADVVGEAAVTVWLPASVAAGDEYYVKVVDLAQAGRDAVVAGNTLEVVAADYPTVAIDDSTGHVDDMPEITVEEAGDYADVYIDWKGFDSAYQVAYVGAIVDGEATINDWAIPHDFKGTYKIVVWLDGADGTFASWVEFSITPDVDWGLAPDISILADELDQTFTLTGTGFSEGTVDADSIQLVLKNFMTGSTIETYESRHDEVDVDDADGFEGDLTVTVIVDAVEAGVVDVKIPVDSTTETFEAAFYSSTPTDEADFTSITHYKMSETSGQNGDDVGFSFINLPSAGAVTIRWIGDTITSDVLVGAGDLNGAFDDDYEIFQLPGGTYSIRAIVTVGGTTRERTLGNFEVLPKFEVREPGTEDVMDTAVVTDLVDLWGSGFPADAVIQTYWFGAEDNDVDPEQNVLATGEFLVMDVEVPHISGGGKDVVVKIEGEDADGVAISEQTTIVIEPTLIEVDDGDYDVGTLAWDGAEWAFLPYLDVPMYPGHIIKVVGFGYLAGEEVGLKVYDADDDLVGSAVIGDGATAQNDGDVEMVAWLPNAKALYPAGSIGCYFTVSGSTSTNKYSTDNIIDFSASDDAAALLILGLANDGEIDTEVKVGEELRAVGLGFRTKSLTLTIVETDDDIKTVSQVNGFFDTSFIVPELSGLIDGAPYTVETLTINDMFTLQANLVLTPANGYVDATFVASGTGFEDDQSIDLTWMGVVEDEVLDTVDGGDIEDGSFSITLTVPNVTPMQYKVNAFNEGTDEKWDDAAFTVLDASAAQMNKTLNEILAKLNEMNIPAVNTKLDAAAAKADAAAAAATAAGTKADAATAAANAAKTASDAATAAATAAGTKADAATAAANAAKTASEGAASAANNLTTLIYGAIGASIIAALAAIVALMQISRKIA